MKSLALLLVLLVACAPAKQETLETADTTAVTENFDNVNEMTEAPAQETEGEFDDEHGGVGGDQLRIVSDATMFSERGEGDETALTTSTFDPQLLERSRFQLLKGRPDYWYKIRLENGKEGWVFGAYTDRQIPTDQRWDKLYNAFAGEYGLSEVNKNEGVVSTVDLIMTGKSRDSDDPVYLILLIASADDITNVNLLLINSAGKKVAEQTKTGVIAVKADGTRYESSDKMICFEIGSYKIENGSRSLETATTCYQLDGEYLREISGD